MNAHNVYTANGNFDVELWYVEFFKEVPSRFDLSIKSDEHQLDSNLLNFSYIKDLFHSEPNELKLSDNLVLYNEDDDDEDEEALDVFGLESESINMLNVIIDHKVIRVTVNSVTIFYNCKLETKESIEKLAKDIFNALPKKEEEDLTAKVSLIKVYQGDYYTTSADIERVDIDVKENYNDDFLPVYEDIKEFLNNRSSGLIMLYGDFGTGKTNLIRHLCSTIPKEYVVVPESIACRLGDPDLISFITGHKDSVFILEDCEQLIEDRDNNPFNGAISTILNMSDGLLSDIVNIKFICTFNAEISKIDPALLRKGRCAAKYQFKELSEDKVKFLNDKYNLGHTEIKPMTLAEVYNADKIDYSDSKELKIGF